MAQRIDDKHRTISPQLPSKQETLIILPRRDKYKERMIVEHSEPVSTKGIRTALPTSGSRSKLMQGEKKGKKEEKGKMLTHHKGKHSPEGKQKKPSLAHLLLFTAFKELFRRLLLDYLPPSVDREKSDDLSWSDLFAHIATDPDRLVRFKRERNAFIADEFGMVGVYKFKARSNITTANNEVYIVSGNVRINGSGAILYLQLSAVAGYSDYTAMFDEYSYGAKGRFIYQSSLMNYATSSNLYPLAIGVLDYSPAPATSLASIAEAMQYDSAIRFPLTYSGHLKDSSVEWNYELIGQPDMAWTVITTVNFFPICWKAIIGYPSYGGNISPTGHIWFECELKFRQVGI